MARRIGVVRTDRLGDMVLTLPLLRSLHVRFPQASIELITRSYVRDLVQELPIINAVHYVDEHNLEHILRENVFDALFFPRPVFSEVWTAVKAAVPLRVGSAFRWYSPLFSFGIKEHRKTALRHEAEFNVRMMDALTNDVSTVELVAPTICPKAREALHHKLAERGLSIEAPFMIIHPGSGSSAQEWDAENFGRAAAQITAHTQLQVFISGTKAEQEKCDRAQAQCQGSINLCGQLELSELMALIEPCSLLMANSTGVLHIAAAMQRPVVGLYPNSPAMSAKRWGPYSSRSRVLSPPNADDPVLRDKMSTISVESVVRNALELLAEQTAK